MKVEFTSFKGQDMDFLGTSIQATGLAYKHFSVTKKWLCDPWNLWTQPLLEKGSW